MYPKTRRPRKLPLDELKRYAEENPDTFLEEIGRHINCSGEAVRQALIKLKITRKKTLNYIERQEASCRDYEQQVAPLPVSRRIYIDESGVSRICCRVYARALRGKRLHCFISGRRTARVNVVAGYCDGRILGEYCYSGSTTARIFEDWFCNFLLPEAQAGDVIIMDNARFHNKKRLVAYARAYKVTIIFLPPYSPDFNPIEHVWANLKRFLRNTKLQFSSL